MTDYREVIEREGALPDGLSPESAVADQRLAEVLAAVAPFTG